MAAVTEARRGLGLGAQIFGASALVVLLALASALLLTKRRADRAADASVAQALAAADEAVNAALSSRSHALRRLLEGLARVPAYHSRASAAIRDSNRSDLLDQADEFGRQGEAAWALITDERGVLRAWTRDPARAGEPLAEGALVGLALEGRTTEGLWIEPTPVGDSLFQAVAVPLLEPGGTLPRGVVVAAIALDSTFAAQLARRTGSAIAIIAPDATGAPRVAISTLPRSFDAALLASVPPRDDAAARDTTDVPRTVQVAGADERWIGVARALRSASGAELGEIVALRSRDRELAAYGELRHSIGLAFVVGLLLALGASVIVARQIARPVRQLARATREVSGGNYGVVLPSDTVGEIGELAVAFRRLMTDLKEKQQLVDYLTNVEGTPPAPAGLASPGAAPLRATDVRAELQPDQLFAGRYEIRHVLGEGGMGLVYKAYDRQLGETVAIKTLRPDTGRDDPVLLERFMQEIKVARRITHRNVVRTHDVGEADGIWFLTMEYVEGTTLSALIRKRGQLPLPITLSVGKQLCRALEVAHEQGVIHRDIKPANLLVAPSGLLKVMDFGIARLLEGRTPSAGLTAHGMMVGTPQYMAPEQIVGDDVDARADLYAAGAVLFECAAGRQMFAGAGMPALIAMQIGEPAPDPRQYNPDIPIELSALILKALEKDPAERWASAAAMHEALDQIPD